MKNILSEIYQGNYDVLKRKDRKGTAFAATLNRILFDYGGLANRLLSVFGIGRISWVEGGALRFPIIVFYIWKNLGLSTILFLAAFETIPVALFEYARLEGASWRKQIFSIALPMIAPTAGAVAMISWINSFSISQQIYSVGGAYPGMQMYTVQNFMSNMYNQYMESSAFVGDCRRARTQTCRSISVNHCSSSLSGRCSVSDTNLSYQPGTTGSGNGAFADGWVLLRTHMPDASDGLSERTVDCASDGLMAYGIGRAGKTKEVKALLYKYDAGKLSGVKPEDYPALMEEAQKL